MKEQVLNYLKTTPFEGKTPTQIGLALGKEYSQASSSVNSSLVSLLKAGLIIRYVDDRRVKYRLKTN